MSGIRRQRWRDRAACAGADPEIFFPAPGATTLPAKAVCASCPVRAECLAWAVSVPERHGVWGGLAERDRRQRRSPGSSRFRGVTWNKDAGKWQARAIRAGRRVHLGVFEDEAEAGRAVLEAGGYTASIPQPREVAA